MRSFGSAVFLSVCLIGLYVFSLVGCGSVVVFPAPVFTYTPFINSQEVYCQGTFSSGHNGIDIGSTMEAGFRAVCGGTFYKSTYQNEITGRYQVNAWIQVNSTYRVNYTFEPFGASYDATPATIQSGYLIASGSSVSAGDTLGNLYPTGESAHVHFGITPNANPMNYFTGEALVEMEAFINN